METVEKETPIKILDLENGLKLEIYNLSRHLTGDRWYVELKACILISVEEQWFNSKLALPTDINTLQQALGEQIVFEYRNKRNFISETEKESVFSEMRVSLENNARKYYGHPDFAARYLIKQYKALQNRPQK